jgi:hypothetical protein
MGDYIFESLVYVSGLTFCCKRHYHVEFYHVRNFRVQLVAIYALWYTAQRYVMTFADKGTSGG